MAACNTRERLSEVNPDAAKYFMEKLLYQIYEHFDEQDLIDVTFKFSSNPTVLVTAHRLILSAASPYFRELFKSEEGICPVIEITNIDSDTFESLIIFCYTGRTSITTDNVDKILKAALILELEDAVANCADIIVENITDFTLERAYALESESQCEILTQKLTEYETRNFMSITQSAEFLNFEANKLQKVLECNSLNVHTEKDAFEAVKRWYEHDAFGRKQHLPDLIMCLRLAQLDMDFLLTNVKPLPGCELIALNALSWISCPSLRSKLTLKYSEQREKKSMLQQQQQQQQQQKKIIVSEQRLLALRIEDNVIFKYDKTEDLWNRWDEIHTHVTDYGVVLRDEFLIFIGGLRHGVVLNEVTAWHCKRKSYIGLPPMKQPRRCHCVTILNDTIYAIGGFYSQALKSVEKYTVSNGWTSVADTIEPRAKTTALTLNNKIYVIGGYNTSINSVECYDPATDRWTRCGDLNDSHPSCGAAAHKGHIYVVSGYKRPVVERFDPQRNEWTKICSINYAISTTGCISFDNQLWVVGGYDSDFVSVYDDENDKWIRKYSIGIKGPYYCFTAHKDLLN